MEVEPRIAKQYTTVAFARITKGKVMDGGKSVFALCPGLPEDRQ